MTVLVVAKVFKDSPGINFEEKKKYSHPSYRKHFMNSFESPEFPYCSNSFL